MRTGAAIGRYAERLARGDPLALVALQAGGFARDVLRAAALTLLTLVPGGALARAVARAVAPVRRARGGRAARRGARRGGVERVAVTSAAAAPDGGWRRDWPSDAPGRSCGREGLRAVPGFAFTTARLFGLQSAWSYERMLGIGFAHAMEPLLRPSAPRTAGRAITTPWRGSRSSSTRTRT